MKLRNKKTGRVIEWFNNTDDTLPNSLAKLNEEWEDYEEPKGNWTIDPVNENCADDGRYTTPDELERYEELGLKFDTEEEAEKAVEKLKAWQRLKDKGFRFTSYDLYSGSSVKDKTEGEFAIGAECSDFVDNKDLDLLFGGEE